MALIESVKTIGLKAYKKSKYTDGKTSIFNIITGANNPDPSKIPNIDPTKKESFKATIQAILDTTVDPPKKMKNQNDYLVAINIKEGGHVDKDRNLVHIALYTKDFNEALVWKKIVEYVATTTSASKTKEEKKAIFGGSCELERSIVNLIKEGWDVKIVKTERFKRFKNILSARFVVTSDSLRADVYIEIVFKSDPSTVYYYYLFQVKSATLTSRKKYTFNDLMLIKEENFLRDSLGGKKYAGMAVMLIGADTDPTQNGYVLSSEEDPFRVCVIIQDGSIIENDKIGINPATIDKKLPKSILSEGVIKTVSPFDAILKYLSRIDESKDAYKFVTDKNDIQFDMLSATHQKEKMGECLLHTSLLGIDARDPASQNSSVDKIVSKKDLESAVKGILLPEKDDIALQSKSASYRANQDLYVCRHFGKSVGEKEYGRYLANEFDLTPFASIRIANIAGSVNVHAKFWFITNADFFRNGCGSVFYDPASKTKNTNGKATVYLYDYDRVVRDNKSNGLCSWGWTTKQQLLEAKCSNAACRNKCFLLSGAKSEHAACEKCGAKNKFRNQFRFKISDETRFPNGLSKALLKSANHIQHDERLEEAKKAKKETKASEAGSSSDPPPAKRPRK
tara:strand:- start:174 stop:2042 length:1869 start_codon:yes stop_codon:yes gene_type:complete